MLHLEDGFARLFVHLFRDQLHIAPHHQAGHLLYRGSANLHRAHVFALAQNGAAVCHCLDFCQLVGNEQNGLSLFFEGAHDFHQLVNFLGSQDGGGFVKNQNLIVPVQHFQNLTTLLHTNGNILNFGIRVHLQAIALRKLHHPAAGRLAVNHQAIHRLCTQDDVVQHREALHQLKVLVHHADVQGGCIVGAVDLNNLPVLFDDTGFRLIQAKQNAHQGGFSRAVFAQQGMNLAPAKLERYVIIGFDSGEFLGDVQHLNYIVVCHTVTPRPHLIVSL